MGLRSLGKVVVKEYISSLSEVQFVNKLESEFNLNNRDNPVQRLNNKSPYDGEIKGNYLKISGARLMFSGIDPTYFFWTEIVGHFYKDENQTKFNIDVCLIEQVPYGLILLVLMCVVALFYGNIFFAISTLGFAVFSFLYCGINFGYWFFVLDGCVECFSSGFSNEMLFFSFWLMVFGAYIYQALRHWLYYQYEIKDDKIRFLFKEKVKKDIAVKNIMYFSLKKYFLSSGCNLILHVFSDRETNELDEITLFGLTKNEAKVIGDFLESKRVRERSS